MNYLNYQKKMYCDLEPWSAGRCFKPDEDESLYKELECEYNIEHVGFNSGCMLYDTNILDNNTKDDLFSIKEKYQKINQHTRPQGSDQPILNIKFLNIWEPFPNNEVSYWQNGTHEWEGVHPDFPGKYGPNKNTKIYHFCRWSAPWINDNQCSYGMTYKQKYHQNLKAF